MSIRLMLLPADESKNMRLVSIPRDIQEQEAFRHVTGIISEVEETDSGHSWEDIEDALETHGYQVLEFILGPKLD